jgi:Trk-type K+ transport system membrane component
MADSATPDGDAVHRGRWFRRVETDRRRWRRRTHAKRRPGQVVVAAFGLTIGIGTFLLTLPSASAGPGRASLLDALFTATSAVCVTGLIVVDTPTYWSTFGQVVILALIQVGGLGILATASLLGLLMARQMDLRSRVIAAAETRTVRLGEVRTVLLGVVILTAAVEAAIAAVLTARFFFGYGYSLGEAAWLGTFHAISAFNNAGFALFSDNLMGFVTDAWVCLPISLAVIVGGLGFPVLLELRRRARTPRRWTLHTKLTLAMTLWLLGAGWVFFTVAEWANPATLGPLDVPGKLLAGFVQGVMPRTAGFNSVDIAGMNTGTWFGTDLLMIIGGGSAGTAGGLKVTTVAVLVLVAISEMRGDPDVSVFRRRLTPFVQRQALSVALLGALAVAAATFVFATTTPYSLDEVLYETVSAFSLVGLSTGITASLLPWQQLILVGLMFVGRVGPVTFASALALRERNRIIRYAPSMPIVG